MRNQKGFTLVELLAVIVVIAILMTVASTSVFGILSDSKDKLLEEQISSLKEAAVTYVNSKRYYLEDCPSTFRPESPSSSLENSCYRKVLISTLVQEELFENKNQICQTENGEGVIVYKVNEGSYSQLLSYVSEDVCSYD